MYLQNDKLSIFITEHHVLEGIVVTLTGHSDITGLGSRGANSLQGLSRGTGHHCEVDLVRGHLGEGGREGGDGRVLMEVNGRIGLRTGKSGQIY